MQHHGPRHIAICNRAGKASVRLCWEPGHSQGLTLAPAPAQNMQCLAASPSPRKSGGKEEPGFGKLSWTLERNVLG